MTPWSLGAAVLAAVAVLAWRPPGRWQVRLRLGGLPRSSSLRPRGAVPVLLAVPAGALGVPWLLAEAATALVGLTALLVGWFVVHQVRSARRRERAARTRAALCDALDLLAAELGAGVLPHAALAGVAPDVPVLAPVERTARAGGDVPRALDAWAAGPGCGVLADVAAAWRVAERAGAPLAAVLHRLAATVRDDLELEREVRAECAPARATGRLMAGLPVFGLSLGAGLGVDPVHLVLRTLPGALCLAAGAALACLGVAWVERVAAGVEAGA